MGNARTRKKQERRKSSGRPPITGIDRTPSGQLSRSKSATAARKAAEIQEQQETAREARRVALEARQRIHAVSAADADDPHLATPIGRLYRSGELGSPSGIGKLRLETAEIYIRRHHRYQAAIDAPERVVESRDEGNKPKPCDICGLSIRCDDCRAEWERDTKAAWDELHGLMTTYERAVVGMVLITGWDQPMSTGVVIRCLDRMRARLEERRAA